MVGAVEAPATTEDVMGLFKRCACKRQTECAHDWYMNKKPRGGKREWANVNEFASELAREPVRITSHTKAREVFAEFERRVEAGTFIGKASPNTAVVPGESLTLQRLLELYDERWVTPERLVRRNIIPPLTKAVAFFDRLWRAHVQSQTGRSCQDGMPANQLKPMHIDALLADYRKPKVRGHGHKTVRSVKRQSEDRLKAVLSGLLQWGVDQGHTERHAFLTDTGKRVIVIDTKYKKKTDVLSEADEPRLLKIMRRENKVLYRRFVFAVLMNMRRGEQAHLRVKDAHLREGWVRVAAEEEGARKTGEERWIPILDRRVAAIIRMQDKDLEGRRKAPNEYLFCDGEGGGPVDWYKAYCRVRDLASLPKSLSWHSATRATWITRWIGRGASLPDLQKFTGHKTLDMLLAYNRPTHEDVAERLRTIGRRGRVAGLLQKG